MRPLILLALVSASALAAPAPSFSTESAGTLGRPDLASSSRVHTLVQLDARRVVALDASGLARLWDVSDWAQLGVASPGTHAVIGPAGLGLPGDRATGCLLAAPLAATSDGRLVTDGGRVLVATAMASTLKAAAAAAYEAADMIKFSGKHLRRDIAARALAPG